MAAPRADIRGPGVVIATPERAPKWKPDEEDVLRLAELGWTAPGAKPSNGNGGGLQFSGGLLPGSARSDTYEDKSKEHKVVCGGQTFSAGLLYVKGLGLEIGLDLNTAELTAVKFWRAVAAEFLGMLIFLFIVVTSIVFRSDFAGRAIQPAKTGDPTLVANNLPLVNAIGTSGAAAQLLIAASFGTMISILVYALAPISGAHLNPAISFGLAFTKKITVVRLLAYTAAQVVGAIIGTLMAAHLNWNTFRAAGGAVNGLPLFSGREIVAAEVLATALLVTIVCAAIDPARAGRVIHIGALGPLAIGGAVFAAHLALLPIDGTSINPARSIGPAIVYGEWRQHWAFWFGPYAGALAAASIYELFLKGQVEDGSGVEKEK